MPFNGRGGSSPPSDTLRWHPCHIPPVHCPAYCRPGQLARSRRRDGRRRHRPGRQSCRGRWRTLRAPGAATRRAGQLREAAGPGRHPRTTRTAPAQDARLRHTFAVNTLLGWYRDGVDVQAACRCCRTYLGHVDPEVDLLVPAGRPGAARARRRASRRHDTGGRAAMSALAPPAAGVLHRPADPPATAPARTPRRLPRHDPAAARLRRRARPASRPPGSTSTDLDAPLIGAFLDHLRDRARQQRPHPQRPPGRDPLAVSLRRLRHPNTPPLIARVLAIPPKRSDQAIVTFLTDAETRRAARRARPRPPGRPPRPRPAPARRPDRAARLRTHRPRPAATCTSAPARTSHCHGKGRKDRITPLTRQTVAVAARLARRTRRPARPTRCFRTRRGSPLTATRSSTASPNTPPPPPTLPDPARPRRSRRTPCATPPRCVCCTPASTPPSSRSGSATKARPPRRIYLHADLALKEKALARTTPPDTHPAATSPRQAARLPRQALTRPTRVMPHQRHRPSLS